MNDRALDGGVRFGDLTPEEQAKLKVMWALGHKMQCTDVKEYWCEPRVRPLFQWRKHWYYRVAFEDE